MRIDSSGRLCLGTNSSSVLSTFALSSANAYSSTGNISNDNVGLKLYNSNGSDGTGVNNYTGIQFNVGSGATSSGGLAYVRTADNQGAFVFNQRTGANSYAEAVRIDSSGVVKLTQSGNNPRFGSLEASGDAFRLKAFSGNASHNATMQFFTGADSPVERMRIDSSGRVGIGTTSMSSLYAGGDDLVIGDGGASDQGMTIYTGTSNQGIIAFADGFTGAAQQYAGYLLYDHTTDSFRVATSGQEQMRIDSSGNVTFGRKANNY